MFKFSTVQGSRRQGGGERVGERAEMKGNRGGGRGRGKGNEVICDKIRFSLEVFYTQVSRLILSKHHVGAAVNEGRVLMRTCFVPFRFQIQRGSSDPNSYKSLGDCFRTIFRREG